MNPDVDLLVADSLIGVDWSDAPVEVRQSTRFDVGADELRKRIRRWETKFAAGNAAATVKAVRSDWQTFFAWCERTGVRAVPVSGPDLMQFLNDQVTLGRRFSTITRYVYSVRAVHSGAKAPDPTQHEDWVQDWKVLKARLRKAKKLAPRQTEPLSSKDMEAVLKAIPASTEEAGQRRQSKEEERRALRDVALLRLASDTLCRESELAAVRLEDLERKNDGSGWTLYVGRSKTDQDGVGAYRFVSNQTHDAISKWCATSGIESGYVFLPVGGRPKRATRDNGDGAAEPPVAHITPDQIARILRRRALRADITRRITGHSARVGSAVDLIEAGFSMSEAAYAGGWESERMVRHYAKKAKAGSNAMAKLRGKQSTETGSEG